MNTSCALLGCCTSLGERTCPIAFPISITAVGLLGGSVSLRCPDFSVDHAVIHEKLEPDLMLAEIMRIRKSTGPRTLPWGMPLLTWTGSDETPSTITLCNLSVGKARIQFSVLPSMPCSSFMRTEEVLLKSRTGRSCCLPKSSDLISWSVRVSSCISQLLLHVGLNPCWLSVKMSFLSRYCMMLLTMMCWNISTDIKSEIRLFADDCVCHREIKNEDDTMKLQRDIDRLGCWARKWGMRFQPVKCNLMQLTRKQIKNIHASNTLEGTVLENVESIKHFRVTSKNDFRWNAHVC